MTPTALARLKSGARSILGRDLPDPPVGQFQKYLELLSKWQVRHRLVGSIDPMWVVENLFLDSLLFLRVLPADARDIVDIGSGAGFPGYPLKIARPEIRLTLIESRRTRVSFLRTVSRELGLKGATILDQRLEDVASDLGRRFDAAVMRCVGSPDRILPLAARIVRASGMVIASGAPSGRKPSLGENLVVEGRAARTSRQFVLYRVP